MSNTFLLTLNEAISTYQPNQNGTYSLSQWTSAVTDAGAELYRGYLFFKAVYDTYLSDMLAQQQGQ